MRRTRGVPPLVAASAAETGGARPSKTPPCRKAWAHMHARMEKARSGQATPRHTGSRHWRRRRQNGNHLRETLSALYAVQQQPLPAILLNSGMAVGISGPFNRQHSHASRSWYDAPPARCDLAAFEAQTACTTPSGRLRKGSQAAAAACRPRSCSRRCPDLTPWRRGTACARWRRASSEALPGACRSALSTKEPYWLCARETTPSLPQPRSSRRRASRSASEQCASAASTTWLAHRWQALPRRSARSASTILGRCSGMCSSMHCRTKWAKGCRQSSSASASTSPRSIATSAPATECSTSRQRMRQPKRWRAALAPAPISSLATKPDMAVGSAVMTVWST
mmetsp:Transcript_29456/g.87582  ORF Transcript_29456/g.87582 Transcript_29456/m.87582 type:complete len:339 (+) Transcript_29456:145-1161(+)